ncbi:MAG: EscU/YscU/HrcU family type III secretion system export apparatus switch protein [Myxococcota bacterium]|nr:EscU/YscU/HrcU family type III secretion system export apparatus switch protein [Myxococcota bacterium]
MAERPHPPSARKLREARRRGDVPRSELASGALVLLAVTATVVWGAPTALAAWRRLFADVLSLSPPDALAASALAAAWMVAPVLAVAAVAAALAAFLQVGPLFTAEPMRLDLTRLGEGLGRAFSPRGVAERLASLPLLALLAALGLWAIGASLHGLAGRPLLSPAEATSAAAGVLGAVLWRAAGLFALAGAVAVVYRRWRWWRDQHMTRREMREEERRTEGDPTARRRRARLHRERALGPSLEEAQREATIALRGASLCVLLAWPDRALPPTVTFVARGAAADAAARETPGAFDEALAVELARLGVGASVPRRFFARLAPHLAALREVP